MRQKNLTHARVNFANWVDKPRLKVACRDADGPTFARVWGYLARRRVTCVMCLALTAGCEGFKTAKALVTHEEAVWRRQVKR